MNSASTVLRGAGNNRRVVEILWHRRETRRTTEKTKIDLSLRKARRCFYNFPLTGPQVLSYNMQALKML